MARILITSGPTRQYLDPVRYLTNASSGRMGTALARAAIQLGHEVVVVSGPVGVEYPSACTRVDVVTTDELLATCEHLFPDCDGLIAAAAPCDYRPERVEQNKIAKTGEPLLLRLVETPDVAAALGASKRSDQWTVGFALETEDPRFRAISKLERKNCDLIVLNGPEAMDATDNSVEILDGANRVAVPLMGPKSVVAEGILRVIQEQLIDGREL